MEVLSSDRFFDHSIIRYPDGSETIEAKAVVLPLKNDFHTVIRGETLEMLADRYYKDSQYAWLIAKANDVWAMWRFDEDFEGERIKIPNLTEFKMNNSR